MPRPKQSKKSPSKPESVVYTPTYLVNKFRAYWQQDRWHKINVILITLIIAILGVMYGISRWYTWSNRNTPVQVGTTFVANYARYFKLDPKETLEAIFDDLDIKSIRLVSYWSVHEKTQGNYNFSELDWQMDMAAQKGAKVSLAIGLRQPRWPECHMPTWAEKLPREQWQPELEKYITAVVERYRNHPALDSYQLENEYFLTVFGICPDHSRDRLVKEFNLVKSLDSSHPLYISRSNNALGWPVNQPQPDRSAVSVYKHVWDKTLTKRYFEYPIPAWYYGTLAGTYKLWSGRDTFIHELQAEPWMPEGFDMATSSLEEQNKSMDAGRLKHRIEYGHASGMTRIDLWGAEWWYWRKVKHNDPSLWDTATTEIHRLHKD
jgi:hypothetical protein